MPKINYYDHLERLACLSSRAVFIACRESGVSAERELRELRENADKLICSLDRRLFSDFMPPIDRAEISKCAHSLSDNIDDSLELFEAYRQSGAIRCRKNKEAEICLRLSEIIESSVASLRRLNRPDELPDLAGVRALLFDGGILHARLARKLSESSMRSCSGYLSSLSQLRRGLGKSFDRIVEVMLSSI